MSAYLYIYTAFFLKTKHNEEPEHAPIVHFMVIEMTRPDPTMWGVGGEPRAFHANRASLNKLVLVNLAPRSILIGLK